MKLSYKSLTLEDIEMYHYYDFICDGDKKEIIVKKKK